MENLLDQNWINKGILIFSPHPDDDCIGMGALICHLARENNEIRIVYMTSGWHGVKDKISRVGKKAIRKKEVAAASVILGVDRRNLVFLEMPFYDIGKICSRDVNLVKKEINKFKPDVIFACGESNDPHRTHGRCLRILKKSIKGLNLSPDLFFYRVWSKFKPQEVDYFFPFGMKLMQKKLNAIKAHKSQGDPAFTKKGISSFWEKEERLNQVYAITVKQRLAFEDRSFCYAEFFEIWDN